MKMKKNSIINGIIPILMLMVLSSCTTYEPPGPYSGPDVLGLTVENIVFSDLDHDCFAISAEIPQEGIKFTMTPVLNEDIDIASVAEVSVDYVNQEPQGNAPFNEEVKLFSGDWGKVEYLNTSQPYNIEVTISPNPSEHEREIELYITGVKDRNVIADRMLVIKQNAEGQ